MMETITRPNGKPYRPRKVTANAVTGDDGADLAGVLVFGTHDPGRALPLAQQYVDWQLESGYAPADPVAGWWRDGFEEGERRWVADEIRGRAGVWFREIAEVPRGGAR